MTTITRYTKKFAHYLRNNRAVVAMEYAILVGVIAVAIGLAIAAFGTNIGKGMKAIGDKVAAPTTATPKGG